MQAQGAFSAIMHQILFDQLLDFQDGVLNQLTRSH